MLGGRFLFPLFVDPEDAAAADAREILHTVASYANPKSESFNPQRLATIIRSTNTNKRSLVSEMTEIDADVLNSLPKWAQAVVQTGCLNGEVNVPAKRSLELQQKPERGRSHKRRSVENKKCGTLLPIESDELRTCRDDLNAEPEENSGIEDEEKLAMLFTQAEIIADSVGKCAESLKKLVGIAMIRQQEEVLKENDIDVFKPDEVKMLAQTLKAMRRNEWIDKLDPELLISLMNMLDIHVKSGLAIDMMGMVLPTEAEDQSEHKNGFVGRLVVAIEVAMCELTVMTTPRIDQRVLSDEIIDNCFQLLYRLIRQMLLPCFDTAYVTTVSVPANTANTNNRRQSIERRMYRSSRINLRAHKSISKTIDRVFHLVCEYMDQLASLVSSVKLSDRWILSLSSSMIELLALDHSTYVTSLQQSALANLRGIFLKYEHHRESVLGDIVEVMLKLPTAKRTLRTVKLLNSANFVQRISTIVVSLIQTIASARIPKLEDDEFGMRSASDGALLKPFSKKSSQKIDSVECILVDTQRYARIFVRKLLQACWKKTDERDYLVVFENFVEDLLVMFVRPEWIGAEYLLEALTSSMASILHATISKVAKNPDLSKSLSALNIVGKICVSIRQYQKKVEQSMMDEDSDSIAIIEEHTNYLRKVMTGEIRTSEGAFSRENCSLFHELALKHITLMHLQRNGQADSKNLMIAKFVSESSCHWSEVDSACEKQERSLWESLWEVPMRSIESTLKVSAPTHELALKASMYLAVKREFCGLFNSLLAHVMGLLSKGIPSLRARVIKCLRMIVDVDPMVMAETGVHVAVQRCSSDARPLVREAAMELIGTYVLLQPLLLDKYFDVLAARVRDKAIKVRKSVCEIFKIALARDATTDLELQRKSACMRCLVERIGDATEDQSVKNFIIDTFQEVWFGTEHSSSRLSNSSNEISDEASLPPGWVTLDIKIDEKNGTKLASNGSVKFFSEDGVVVNTLEEAWSMYRTPMVTPSSVVKSNDSKLDNSSEVVATIIEVVHGMPNLTWFAELLKRLLGICDSNTKKLEARSRPAEIAIAEDRSKKIVTRLIGCLMDIQEGTLLNTVSIQDGHQQFVSCMTALSVFCEAKPQLLAHHLETIRVYLKELDAKIQSLSVSMINNILRVKRVPQTIAEKLEDNLKDLVLRSPPSVVGPSIDCLVTLSAQRSKTLVLLLRLFERFYLGMRELERRTSLSNLSGKDNVLQRALFSAGKIVGATDFDKCQEIVVETKDLKVGTITESLYELYRKFIRTPGNDSCAAKAVQGMGFLFPIRPRLFLQAQQDGLLCFLLKSSVLKAKLQCLVSMNELLVFEEQRLDNGQAARMMNQSKSKEQLVQGDQEADASLIGNVMQAELENILRLSVEHVPQIRKQAIACIGALLTQGLVNPLQCIPNLVALETDRVPDVRDAAFSHLITLFERFGDQLRTPTVKGIQDSYSFQLGVYGNSTPLGIGESGKEFCLFGRLYTNCLKPTRSHELFLLKALVSQFTDHGSVLNQFKRSLTSGSNASASDLKYLCYLAQIVSTLPYEVEDEPLYVIYLINRYVSLRLGCVLEDLNEAFAKAGVAPELLKCEDSDLSMVKIDEYRPLRPMVGSTLATLLNNGRVAFAIALLLHLKFALQHNYQLDNEKCATYQPSTTAIPAEAKERSPRLLSLPSIDDLCKTDDPIELNWNLFMVTWHAARKDQKLWNIDLETLKPNTTPKRRRSRKSVAGKMQKKYDTNIDGEDEYVENFA